MTLTPQAIHRLDQAAVDALNDVDHLADDPETTRRLAERGEALYGFELTTDLDTIVRTRMGLAGWAAFATIRLNQARAKLTDRDKEIGRLEVYVAGLEQQLAAQQPVVNAARDLIHTYTTAEGVDVDVRYAAAEATLRKAISHTDPKQPDTDRQHLLVVAEPGVWTLRHPVSCTGECPMFALMHAAMATAEIPAGQYEVQPNDLGDGVFIGDRIDGPAVIGAKPQGMPRVNCKRTGEHPAHVHESRLPNRTARFWCEPGGSRP